MDTKYTAIDDKAVTSARRFRREEAILLDCLLEVDRERVFERLGYPSLYAYCTQRLRLSESCAYAFISVARKSKAVPLLKEAVSSGRLNVSQAKRIVSVIEPKSAELWIETAATKTQRDLERLVAAELPAPPLQERVRAVGKDMAELKLVIPEALRKDIERLQQVRGCSIIEAIGFAVKESLERHDPVRKAQRNRAKPRRPELSLRKGKGRRKNPARQVHEVVSRDQSQCTFRYPDGTRCPNRRYLELHHRIPVARGGPNTADNLTTLCSGHHRALHAGQPATLYLSRHAVQTATVSD